MLDTIESGIMTADLAKISAPVVNHPATSEEFIDAVADCIRGKLASDPVGA